MIRFRATACLTLAVLLALIATPARARQQDAGTFRPGLVPADHWSRSILVRFAATGLLDPASAALAWPARRDDIRALLESALAKGLAGNADGIAAAEVDLARTALDRFDSDFPVNSAGAADWSVGLTIGWRDARGELLAGRSVAAPAGFEYTGPRSAGLPARAFAETAVAASLGAAFRVFANVATAERTTDVRAATLASRLGPVDLWAGRRSLDLGAGPGRSLVLAGTTPFDGAGIATPDGFRLPGFLAGLGRVSVDQLVAQLDRSGDIAHPWFIATRITLAPSDAFVIGLNRAALFGGRGNERVTAGRLVLTLIGVTDIRGKDSDFENQVASVDLLWRPRPRLLFHAEYAADDSGFGFVRVPAITVGATFTGVPFAPALSIGGELTGIARSCCSYPAWYQHGVLADGWTADGVLLGHPLGGNGLEAAFEWRLDPVSRPVIAAGRFYARDRGRENLFAPDRHGSSLGLEAGLRLDAVRSLRLDIDVEAERGDGWHRSKARLAGIVAF